MAEVNSTKIIGRSKSMHKNEIRYLSDDDLREVFKECTKRLFERGIKLPLSEDDVWKYIQSVDMIEAIDIEEAAQGRQKHLKALHCEPLTNYTEFMLKTGKTICLGELLTYEEFVARRNSGCIIWSDGYCKWAYEDKVSDLEYEFYSETEEIIKETYGFTHIFWSNK